MHAWVLSADETCEEDIEQRVGAAARVIGAMRKEVYVGKEGVEESHEDEGVQ